MIAVRTRFRHLVDTDEAHTGRCGRQSRLSALAPAQRAGAQRLRALALFRRRLSERADSLGMPASENLHKNGSVRARAARPFYPPGADIVSLPRHVRLVPTRDSCTAASSVAIRSTRGHAPTTEVAASINHLIGAVQCILFGDTGDPQSISITINERVVAVHFEVG